MTKLAAVALGISLLGGCYFGRSPSAKQGAYVANGAAAVAGVAILASAAAGGDCSGDDQVACGAGQGAVAGAKVFVGASLVALAAIGTIINLAVPTKAPAIAPVPTTRAAIVAKPGAPLSAALELDLDRALAE